MRFSVSACRFNFVGRGHDLETLLDLRTVVDFPFVHIFFLEVSNDEFQTLYMPG